MERRSEPGASICAPLRPGTHGVGKAAPHVLREALAALSLAALYALTLLLGGVSSHATAASTDSALASHAASVLAGTGTRVVDALALVAAVVAGLPVLALLQRKASRCSAAGPPPALLLLLLAGITKPVDGACTGNGTITCGDYCCSTDTEVCNVNHGHASCESKQTRNLLLLLLIIVFPVVVVSVARVFWVKAKARRQAQLEFEQQHQAQEQQPHDSTEPASAQQEKQLSQQQAASVERTEKAVAMYASAEYAATTQPHVLPRDLFTPRADEMLLALFLDISTYNDSDAPASAAEAAQDGAWVSRMCIAAEDALFQRPAGWSNEVHCPDATEPKATVPYNVGFPNSPPQFGTVDAAAWRALYAALFSGCDALSDKFLLDFCGVRLFDVRRGLFYGMGRLFWRIRRLSTPLKCVVYPLLLLVLIPFCFSMYLFVATMLLETLLFVLLALLFCTMPFSGKPLRGVGAEARNAAHSARRMAVIDDFAKAHNLLITYECVHYIGWGDPAAPPKKPKKWFPRRQPALRVRKATPDGPPAGLLLVDSSKV